MLLIPIELNKNTKHAYTHAYKLKFFSPFLSIINKGVKIKTSKNIYKLKEILLFLIYKTNENIFFLYSKQGIKNKGCSSPFCLNTNMIPIRRKCVKEVHIDTN